MDIELLTEVFYCAEEYQFYGNEEYKNVFDSVTQIVDNIENSDEYNEVKHFVINWKAKNKFYKTLNFNSLTIPMNDSMFNNLLTLLSIRERSLYKQLSASPLTLNIIFDTRKFDKISLDEFNKIEELGSFIQKKKIYIHNGQYFTGDIFDFFIDHDYELIYCINTPYDIQSGTYNICVDINNPDLESIIRKHSSSGGKKVYITGHGHYKLTTDITFKYCTKSYTVILDDRLPGQHIEMTFDNRVHMLCDIVDFDYYDNTITYANIVALMKKEMIRANYIEKKCLSCNDKILCMLGVADSDCEKVE